MGIVYRLDMAWPLSGGRHETVIDHFRAARVSSRACEAGSSTGFARQLNA